MSSIIRCKSIKYGGSLNYEWDMTLIEHTTEHILLKGEIGRKLIHHKRGKTFTFEYPNVEYFPLTGWYTVSIEKIPTNKLFYYCNISMPPEFADGVLTFIDLDLDLIRRPDEDWTLVDEDEFLENSVKLNYPEEVIARAREETENLFERIKSGTYPFDGWLLDRLKAD